jgi:hypothetical protein
MLVHALVSSRRKENYVGKQRECKEKSQLYFSPLHSEREKIVGHYFLGGPVLSNVVKQSHLLK